MLYPILEYPISGFPQIKFLDPFHLVTHIVEPAYGEASWVNELAAGVVRRSGEQNATTNALASAVSNPAITCELLMTDKVSSILARIYLEPAGGDKTRSRVAPESILTIACYVSPSSLAWFGEVIFMSALFEETLPYQVDDLVRSHLHRSSGVSGSRSSKYPF